VRPAQDFEITAIAGKTRQERPNRSQSTHYLIVWRSPGNRNQGDVICVHVFATMVVLPSLALAMLMAVEPATHAQEYLSQEAAYIHRHHAAPPLAYDAQANPNYGFGPLRPVGPNDVVSGNRIIGRDPDPFIRGELLRHYDSGWPD
jgi:hypothetical protein